MVGARPSSQLFILHFQGLPFLLGENCPDNPREGLSIFFLGKGKALLEGESYFYFPSPASHTLPSPGPAGDSVAGS